MRKSEDAVIPMHKNFNVTYVLGDEKILNEMKKLKRLSIFSPIAENFLDCWSKNILTNPDARHYSDVATLGFWCRRSSIRQMAQRYEALENTLGRGVVFHISPSNVAVNFAYSLIAALLSGNASIIRLPSKDFPQVDLLCHEMENALQNFPELRHYILLVRYGHDKEVNDFFSSICDTRVIWGGDSSIREIRRSPLPSRANEITFADRYSIAVIQSSEYLCSNAKEETAEAFYNDTYLTDQNACSSPRIVVWLGDDTARAQDLFWQHLHKIVKDRYVFQPVQSVDKLTNIYRMSVTCSIKMCDMPDNYITRVKVSHLDDNLMTYKMNSGFFMEYQAAVIEEMLPLCTERCQTISCCGIEPEVVRNMIYQHGASGGDRVVSFGQTMNFSLVWDGIDLICAMSRQIAG